MEIIAKIGDFVKQHRDHLWTAFFLGLVGWSAYNLGLIRARQGERPLQEAAVFRTRTGIVSQTPMAAGQGTRAPIADRSDLRVVASKSSQSKKYHHPWCPGAKQIKESNRLWFPSVEAARSAGYSLAGNCER